MSIYFKLFVILSSLPFFLSYAIAEDNILVKDPNAEPQYKKFYKKDFQSMQKK